MQSTRSGWTFFVVHSQAYNEVNKIRVYSSVHKQSYNEVNKIGVKFVLSTVRLKIKSSRSGLTFLSTVSQQERGELFLYTVSHTLKSTRYGWTFSQPTRSGWTICVHIQAFKKVNKIGVNFVLSTVRLKIKSTRSGWTISVYSQAFTKVNKIGVNYFCVQPGFH